MHVVGDQNTEFFTAMVDGRVVGELTHPDHPNPQRKFRPEEPYVFLLVGPDAMELIAPPTQHFLEKFLRLKKVFVYDRSIQYGEDIRVELLEAAHRATHVVIIMTPKARTNEDFVQTLNTFMQRREQGSLNPNAVHTVLWDMSALEGYARAVKHIRYFLISDQTADFVEKLWPHLSSILLPQNAAPSTAQVQNALAEYADVAEASEIDGEIYTYLHRIGLLRLGRDEYCGIKQKTLLMLVCALALFCCLFLLRSVRSTPQVCLHHTSNELNP